MSCLLTGTYRGNNVAGHSRKFPKTVIRGIQLRSIMRRSVVVVTGLTALVSIIFKLFLSRKTLVVECL